VTRRRGRRGKKLLDDLGDRGGYSHLKEEALDRNKWRNRFGRGCGPVVWQITDDDDGGGGSPRFTQACYQQVSSHSFLPKRYKFHHTQTSFLPVQFRSKQLKKRFKWTKKEQVTGARVVWHTSHLHAKHCTGTIAKAVTIHFTKTYRRSRGIAPPTLNLDKYRNKWPLSCPGRFTSEEVPPVTQIIRDLVICTAGLEVSKK
jgi:hypothetical protein